jgi:serine/threonine protein kinase
MPGAAAPIPIRWPTPGDTITAASGRVYSVGQKLNEGGYALVFEGTNDLGRPVALKVYKPLNRLFAEVQAQWDRESAIMRKLAHAHVTSILDAFVVGNLFFIVMERAWGSVDQYIRQVGALTDHAVRDLAAQMLDALQHTHLLGVLHRDITIYNTLVFSRPVTNLAWYKLADFGVSKEFIDPWNPKVAYTEIAHPSFRPPEFDLAPVPYSNERTVVLPGS